MKFLISYLAFGSLLLSHSPAIASNCISQTECELQREYQGWLDATCTYYVDGMIAEDYANDVLRRVNLSFIAQIVLLRDQTPQQDNWIEDKKVDLRYDSRCDSLWPKISI